MTTGASPPTKPAHGVIATRPATAPDAAPSVVACPLLTRSTMSQPSIAADAATNVLRNACAATPLAASADPALNPNQPNHRMPVPSKRERKRVGRHRLARPAAAPSEQQHERERAGARVDVHDRAAGEVERAPLGQPPAREHPVGDRQVDEQRPQAEEPHPGGPSHAVCDRSRDEGRCDDRERQLERDECERRNRCRTLPFVRSFSPTKSKLPMNPPLPASPNASE